MCVFVRVLYFKCFGTSTHPRVVYSSRLSGAVNWNSESHTEPGKWSLIQIFILSEHNCTLSPEMLSQLVFLLFTLSKLFNLCLRLSLNVYPESQKQPCLPQKAQIQQTPEHSLLWEPARLLLLIYLFPFLAKAGPFGPNVPCFSPNSVFTFFWPLTCLNISCGEVALNVVFSCNALVPTLGT